MIPLDDSDFNPDILDYSVMEFGSFLRAVRKAKNISLRDFEVMVGKKRAYLSDIERGNSNPPDKELLDTMIEQLNIKSYLRIVNTLYDLAAIGRDSVPADLKSWVMESQTHRDLIRRCRDKKLSGEQISNLLKTVEDM